MQIQTGFGKTKYIGRGWNTFLPLLFIQSFMHFDSSCTTVVVAADYIPLCIVQVHSKIIENKIYIFRIIEFMGELSY